MAIFKNNQQTVHIITPEEVNSIILEKFNLQEITDAINKQIREKAIFLNSRVNVTVSLPADVSVVPPLVDKLADYYSKAGWTVSLSRNTNEGNVVILFTLTAPISNPKTPNSIS